MTSADVQRLQDTIYDASREIVAAAHRATRSLASQLETELDDARDEAIYLKVKLRKHEPIARSEFSDVRDRVENIRSRARGDAAGRYSTARPPAPTPTDRPVAGRSPSGAGLDIGPRHRERECRSGPSSTSACRIRSARRPHEVEDRFEATTLVDLTDDRGRVLVPAGSTMRGVVSSVKQARAASSARAA